MNARNAGDPLHAVMASGVGSRVIQTRCGYLELLGLELNLSL